MMRISQRWVSEEPYELSGDMNHGITDAPRRARESLRDCKPKLFRKFSFCFQDSYPDKYPSTAVLKHLVTMGGGKVLAGSAKHRRRGVSNSNGFVLCAPDLMLPDANRLYQQCGLEPLSLMWVLDCISLYRTMPMDTFKLREVDISPTPSLST